MSGVRVKINQRGARKLLTSKGIQDDLDARAQRIQAAAGEGFMTRQRHRRKVRYGAQVRTETEAGRRAQAEGNVLTIALNAGR